MKYYAGPVARLVEEFSKLPGIGPKTAQRLAFHILNAPGHVAQNLAEALVEVRNNIKKCGICGNFTDADPCGICSDTDRNQGLICIVEHPRDVVAIEKTGNYKGVYHVLHGALNPMEGIGANQLNVKSLLQRLQHQTIEEIILATNSSVEGDTTALYLSRLLKSLDINVTKLAHGIPVGAELEYTDEYTLIKALQGRQRVE